MICGHPGPFIIRIIVYQILEGGVNGGGGLRNVLKGQEPQSGIKKGFYKEKPIRNKKSLFDGYFQDRSEAVSQNAEKPDLEKIKLTQHNKSGGNNFQLREKQGQTGGGLDN